MQKQDVINRILKEYAKRSPINRKGLEKLYNTAECRGYHPMMIYIRSEYIPPNNDPMQEVIHNRIYAEDWEFRSVFNS